MAVSRFSLIRILADGSFHSCERLGRALGLSRAGVEHQLHGIEALGLRISKVRGRGYRLAEPVDLLDRDALAARLRKSSPVLSVEVRDECASTSTALAAEGTAHGTVLVCEHQSAGRGRRGNTWFSAPARGLTFSLLWRFSQGAAGLAGLSLAVAVGAVRALERLGMEGVQLKWPNDLYCGGRKLGGILIESSGDALGPSTVIVGLGLNVRLDPALRGRIDRPVTDLASCGGAAVPPRTVLLGALLESLAEVLTRFAREGFAPFRDDWQRRHAWQGRRVRLALAGRVAEGEALGVAEDGALVLSSSRG